MARIAVLGGCGTVGSVAVRMLAASDVFSEIVVGDINFEKARRFVQSLGSDKVTAVGFDASEPLLEAIPRPLRSRLEPNGRACRVVIIGGTRLHGQTGDVRVAWTPVFQACFEIGVLQPLRGMIALGPLAIKCIAEISSRGEESAAKMQVCQERFNGILGKGGSIRQDKQIELLRIQDVGIFQGLGTKHTDAVALDAQNPAQPGGIRRSASLDGSIGILKDADVASG